jgi:hypothetical protein
MASGNISPRQKMINMMYLVLTAMLALNVSKDILRVLAKLDLGMNATVTTVERGTATLYQAIQAQVSENPRAIPINERAIQVKAKSDEIFGLLATTKEEMIKLKKDGTRAQTTATFLRTSCLMTRVLVAKAKPKKSKKSSLHFARFSKASQTEMRP